MSNKKVSFTAIILVRSVIAIDALIAHFPRAYALVRGFARKRITSAWSFGCKTTHTRIIIDVDIMA